MADVVLTARVRMKKRDGRAEFTEKHLRWTPDDNVTGSSSDAAKPVVVPWTNVQDQQVSSLTSPKAMIRLRMGTSNSAVLVLEFVSTESLEHAFEVRERAKELIAKWIVASGKQRHAAARAPLCNSAEIKQRAALLAANPTLKRQHTEMVNDGLISEEDFWASRRHLIANEASKRQKTGKTSAILTDLSGDNDASGHVVKYNLNAEVIHQIFVQYPAVHLAYDAQVPDKMTETEFWSAFFKSKYFHRDRKAGHEDLFTKFEEQERAIAQRTSVDPRSVVDPLVDLTATEEDLSSLQRSMIRSATASTTTDSTGGTKDDGSSRTIAKFNRHGAYVLDPSHAGKLPTKTHSDASAAGSAKPRATYRDNLRDATLLDDLETKQPPPFYPLALEDESRYFQQQQQSADATTTTSSSTNNDASTARFQRVCRKPIALDQAFPSASTSLSVLHEIVACADTALESAANGSSGSGAMTAEFIPPEFKLQVRTQFMDVHELLRHFLAFKEKVANGGGIDAQRKLDRIVAKMSDKYDELVKIRENLPPHDKNLLAPLLKPFDDQLNLAFI